MSRQQFSKLYMARYSPGWFGTGVFSAVGRTNGLPEDRRPEDLQIELPIPPRATIPSLLCGSRAMTTAFGAAAILPVVGACGMGAEDFASFVEPEHGVRGNYFCVGGTPATAFGAAHAGGPPVPSHQGPWFRLDPDPSSRVATEATLVAALELLGPAGAKAQAGSAGEGR